MAGSGTYKTIVDAVAPEFPLHGYVGESMSTIADQLYGAKRVLTHPDFAKVNLGADSPSLYGPANAQSNTYPCCRSRGTVEYFMLMGT